MSSKEQIMLKGSWVFHLKATLVVFFQDMSPRPEADKQEWSLDLFYTLLSRENNIETIKMAVCWWKQLKSQSISNLSVLDLFRL